jgi:hypothetical protein
MGSGAALVQFFQIIVVIGSGVTAARLYTSGLFRKYRFFFLFLLLNAAVTGLTLTMDVSSPAYYRIWIWTTPIQWLSYILVVLELYRLVFEQFRGLYSLGRWSLYASVVIGVALSAISLGSARQAGWLTYYAIIERGVSFTLMLFLFLILAILSRFPIRLSRNVVVHSVVYSAMFMSSTVAMFLYTVARVRVRQMNAITMGITALCFVLWATLLSRQGEARQVSRGGTDPAYEEKVLAKLRALNQAMLRAGKN